MFDKFTYIAIIIFIFLISFLTAVGSPDIVIAFFRNIFSFATISAVLAIVLITMPMLLSISKDQQNNDFLYY